MCLLDTIDGALMFSLYIQPAANFLPPKPGSVVLETASDTVGDELPQSTNNHRDPVAFLYYSIVLTVLTVIVAIVIGVIQLLTMIVSITDAKGKFWDDVQVAGDYYDAIGGGICGCFIIFGGLSVILYKPWRRWMDRRHARPHVNDEECFRDDTSEQEAEGCKPAEGDLHESESDGTTVIGKGATIVGKGTSSRVTATEQQRYEEEIV